MIQLKPVRGRYIFQQPSCPEYHQAYGDGTDSLWRSFSIINLTHNHRQGEDREYADVLNRIRVGELNQEDKALLNERVREEDHPDILTASIRIFSTVAEVVEYNDRKMAKLPGTPITIKAHNFTLSNSNFKPNVNKAGRVGDTQFLNCLQLKLKSRVMLIHNVCVMDSLVNGAVGELIGVVERRDGTVDKLVIKFDNEQTGAETRKAFPILSSQYPGGTPVFRKELEYSIARSNSLISSTAKVIQFPIIPAFAVTSHRFQGQTIPWPSKVVVSLRKVFQAAMAYVMLSRVQSITQLFILGELQESKIYADSRALTEIRRLELISFNNNPSPWNSEDLSATKIVFLNTRSLKNKSKMITSDYNLLKATAILLSETWLDGREENTSLDGYKASFQGGGRGGGTVAFYRSEFQIMEEIIEDNKYYITKLSSEDIDIINIYRSQTGSIIEVLNIIEKLISNKIVIIGGDLNICFLNNRVNPFTTYLESVGFNQLVDRPSHIEGRLLDHLYFRQPKNMYTISIETVAKYYSDHDAICATLKKVG